MRRWRAGERWQGGGRESRDAPNLDPVGGVHYAAGNHRGVLHGVEHLGGDDVATADLDGRELATWPRHRARCASFKNRYGNSSAPASPTSIEARSSADLAIRSCPAVAKASADDI